MCVHTIYVLEHVSACKHVCHTHTHIVHIMAMWDRPRPFFVFAREYKTAQGLNSCMRVGANTFSTFHVDVCFVKEIERSMKHVKCWRRTKLATFAMEAPRTNSETRTHAHTHTHTHAHTHTHTHTHSHSHTC